MDVHWYPVYTNPRAEKKAFEALEQKRISTYLPLHKQLRQWSDRKKWVDLPLIPSYLFVQISITQMVDVLMCKGVSRFLYFSGKVATIPDRQINQLKLLLANDYELEVVEKIFEPGKTVIVKAGPLQGLRGELISWHSSQKLLVRIDYIAQSILVQVSPAFLEVL
ncbi:UpxY family transcription antiterminator [Paradesertivirga mongoliensis]|uniref:UpxY family transcription antiterminator n=1 Tax=Paradesertivirga mongoliensis TaxID=2100740 RepID=A0ABW4ZGN8_9SPHI|nr:UpxY family transcription antiterminator [Pedobacter mongoliensis]